MDESLSFRSRNSTARELAMEFFQSLGSQISSQWKRSHYDEECFAEVASAALLDRPPHRHVSLRDIVHWATQEAELPHQTDLSANFGDPPLTVYLGRGFRVEVLFWTDGVPAVHQHGFSGAFHVMQGSSIHSLWDFEPIERLETRLLIGRVQFKHAEILVQGDTRAILAGDQMYHATYHLDLPSVSVVARTSHELDQQPQYKLWPPAIASASLDRIATVKRQTQLLQMLLTSKRHREFHELVPQLLATKEAYSLFEFLVATFNLVRDEEERSSLLVAARTQNPSLMAALEPVLVQAEIDNRLAQIRRNTQSDELRYFLALLRNIPDRTVLLQLIRQRHVGCDPVSLIVDWVRQLSEQGFLGVRFHRSWLLMLDCLLRNRSDADTERTFAEESTSDYMPRLTAEIRELAAAVSTAWFLRPLFTSSTQTQEPLQHIPRPQLADTSSASAKLAQ